MRAYAGRACRVARHLDTPALIASPMATITATPSTAFVPALPMRLAISAPKKYESPTYIPIQPIPATSAPRMNIQNRTRKIPDTKAGIVTEATKL